MHFMIESYIAIILLVVLAFVLYYRSWQQRIKHDKMIRRIIRYTS